MDIGGRCQQQSIAPRSGCESGRGDLHDMRLPTKMEMLDYAAMRRHRSIGSKVALRSSTYHLLVAVCTCSIEDDEADSAASSAAGFAGCPISPLCAFGQLHGDTTSRSKTSI